MSAKKVDHWSVFPRVLLEERNRGPLQLFKGTPHKKWYLQKTNLQSWTIWQISFFLCFFFFSWKGFARHLLKKKESNDITPRLSLLFFTHLDVPNLNNNSVQIKIVTASVFLFCTKISSIGELHRAL